MERGSWLFQVSGMDDGGCEDFPAITSVTDF